MTNYPYFCNYALLSFKWYCYYWECVPISRRDVSGVVFRQVNKILSVVLALKVQEVNPEVWEKNMLFKYKWRWLELFRAKHWCENHLVLDKSSVNASSLPQDLNPRVCHDLGKIQDGEDNYAVKIINTTYLTSIFKLLYFGKIHILNLNWFMLKI